VDARHKSLSSGRAFARTRGPGMTISVAFNDSVMAGLVPAIDDPNGCLAPTFFGALELEF
jgi:hypothetical protein